MPGNYIRTKEMRERAAKTQRGKKLSEETKRKIGEAHKGKKCSVEQNKKNREARIKYLSSGRRKYKNTSIELKIEAELKRVNLNYQKQVAICKVGVVDFFLPDGNIIIECDGDYWHNRKREKQKDATKDLVWMFNHYKVFRFWEHEINESPKNCIKAVLKYINKEK